MVKVLFIDDDPQAHATLRVVLPEPYVLLSAYTGRQGVETAAREGPDVVLLDINLPDMDGLRALRLIAARPLAPPVVMLTASIIGQRAFSLMRCPPISAALANASLRPSITPRRPSCGIPSA